MIDPELRAEVEEAQGRVAEAFNSDWMVYTQYYHEEFDAKGFTAQQGFLAWMLVRMQGAMDTIRIPVADAMREVLDADDDDDPSFGIFS